MLVMCGARPCGNAVRDAPEHTGLARRSAAALTPPADLSFQTIHCVTGRDDRPARAGAVVGVALLHPVGADERDAEIAVHIRSDDGLVVAANHPGKRLLGIRGCG